MMVWRRVAFALLLLGSGLAAQPSARAADMGLTLTPRAAPTVFWDLYGEKGHPIRTTIMEMGPLLLSRMLNLNDVQEGVINIAFKYADDDPQLGGADSNGLVDLKDLRAVIQHLVSDEGKAELKALGGLSSATAGVILRQLIAFEDQGADVFFGEPEFDTADLMRVAGDGRGREDASGCIAARGCQAGRSQGRRLRRRVPQGRRQPGRHRTGREDRLGHRSEGRPPVHRRRGLGLDRQLHPVRLRHRRHLQRSFCCGRAGL